MPAETSTRLRCHFTKRQELWRCPQARRTSEGMKVASPAASGGGRGGARFYRPSHSGFGAHPRCRTRQGSSFCWCRGQRQFRRGHLATTEGHAARPCEHSSGAGGQGRTRRCQHKRQAEAPSFSRGRSSACEFGTPCPESGARQVSQERDSASLSSGKHLTLTTSIADQLHAAKAVLWRGSGDLPQRGSWLELGHGLWLLLDFWSGLGSLLIGLCCLGVRCICLSAEHDAMAKSCIAYGFPNTVIISDVHSFDVRMLDKFFEGRKIAAVLIGGGSPRQGKSSQNLQRKGLTG